MQCAKDALHALRVREKIDRKRAGKKRLLFAQRDWLKGEREAGRVRDCIGKRLERFRIEFLRRQGYGKPAKKRGRRCGKVCGSILRGIAGQGRRSCGRREAEQATERISVDERDGRKYLALATTGP